MATKRDYSVEREARREDAKRKRQERVISAYVKLAHPGTYKEACEFFDKLDAVYPNKRDLRKTPHFLAYRKEAEKKLRKNTTDNFTLEIPLMRVETAPSTTRTVDQDHAITTWTTDHATTTAADQDHAITTGTTDHTTTTAADQDHATTTAADQDHATTTVVDQGHVTTTAADQDHATTTVVDQNLLPLDSDTLETILTDLREDPNLQMFFDNFDFEMDDCPLW